MITGNDDGTMLANQCDRGIAVAARTRGVAKEFQHVASG